MKGGISNSRWQIKFDLLPGNSYLVIVIPLVVRLYVEIIHKLQRVDYLTNRWTTTYIIVDLAHHEIFRAKVVNSGINWAIRLKRTPVSGFQSLPEILRHWLIINVSKINR